MALGKRHGGHDHSSMSSMGSMSDMDSGTIVVTWFPQLYWIFVGSVIAAFAVSHLFNVMLCRQRLLAARSDCPTPAKPRRLLLRWMETLTALLRETANTSIPRWSWKVFSVPAPAFGSTALVLGNLIVLIALCFYKLDPSTRGNFQNIAYRCGFLSLGQIPLLFLLAGKNNIVSFFTGHSYERLNKIHRWAARTVLLTVTLHMAYWFADWAPYDYIGYQIKNDRHFTQTGLIAWAVLVWIVFSSFAPIRKWSYELFYVQHVLSFVAFITMVFVHTPAEDHAWLWAGVAAFVFDRLCRMVGTVRLNRSRAWQAELSPLPGRMTQVTLHKPRLNWKAGQHAVIAFHSIAPLQGHPFTISSIPSDGKLEFMIKAQKGATLRLYDYAQKRPAALPMMESGEVRPTTPLLINGVHGSMRPLRQFDSVVLLAGSSGASFTMPLLRDLIVCWKKPRTRSAKVDNAITPAGVVTRRIRFVWVVRSSDQISWFAKQLNQTVEDVQRLDERGDDVQLRASIYVTCDDRFTDVDSDAEQTIDRAATLLLSEKEISHHVKEGSKSSSEAGSGQSSVKQSTGRPDTVEQKTPRNPAHVLDIREVDPRSALSPAVQTCGPDGTCCCRTTVTDENIDGIAQDAVCHCNCEHKNAGSGSSFETPVEKGTSSKQTQQTARSRRRTHPHISLLSGRPHPRSIIRTALERAEGESAVVVCGPRGLNSDARRAVVSLSDERAIGRETGALGVWFHEEGFGW